MTRFQRLALATVVGTLVLVTIGVIVRATGSGLGCPDWPFCKGQLVPAIGDTKAWLEWIHRGVAAILGFLILLEALVAWLDHRDRRSILWPSFGAVLLVGFQAWLGRETVLLGNSGPSVTAHLATAMALQGVLVFLVVRSFFPARIEAADFVVEEPETVETAGAPETAGVPETTWAGAVADEAGRQRSHGFTLLAAFGAASVFALLLFGSEVMAKKAWGIYPDWPLMGGTLFPPYTDLTSTQILHRWVAIAVGFIGVGIAVVAWRTQRHRPVVLRVTMLAAVLYPLQAVAGAAQILTGLAPWTQVVHLGLGATIWTLMATVTVLSYYTTRAAAGAPGPLLAAAGAGRRGDALASARAYLALTKPRIIFLLLVTTVPAMVLAARQVPGMEPGRWAWLVTWTLLSGSLAAGGANAINSYLDRDIDAIMARTRRRPLPAQTVAPERAVAFGLVLGAGALGLMAAMVNLVAAFLTLLAIGCYVVVYTILLKRTSTQNIVIGGVAGALPPLIGWAAVTGSLALVPIVMFGIVFYWTPPHFWALSLRHRADYEAARIPMLPVVRGVVQTARQVGLYSILLVAVSLLLVSVARLGAVYLGAAAILGVIFLALALRLWLAAGAEPAATDRATRLYQFSMAYLGLLFAAMVLDTLVALPLA